MKAKIVRGNSFRGVLDYASDNGKCSDHIKGTMSGSTSRELSKEFGLSRQIRPDATRPVWHSSLALPKGEDVSIEVWEKIASRYMEKMGLAENQWTAFKHGDTDHKHIHIVASRIGLDGQLWYGKWEARTAIEATQELEREFNLTITPGLRQRADKKLPSFDEIQMAARDSKPLPRIMLQEVVDSALEDGEQSIFAFIERVEAAGVTALPSVASTGKMNGFSFEVDGISFKASQLGKGYSWKNLQQKGVIYEQDRDGGELIATAQRIKEKISSVDYSSAKGEARNPERPISGSEKFRTEPGAEHSAHGEKSTGNAADSRGDLKDNFNSVDQNTRERRRTDSEIVEERSQDRKVSSEDGKFHQAHRKSSHENGERNYTVQEEKYIYGWLSDWSDSSNVIADLASPIVAGRGEIAPDHKVKINAWKEQHKALKSPYYRITAMPRGNGNPINFGKTEDGEVSFTAGQVEGMIPKLRQKNAMGYDIYITPLDPNHHYLVVDDITRNKLNEFGKEEYQPCLIQESSENNYQAIIKADKAERPDEQSIANKVVQKINQEYGDKKFTGVIHPFRMAGFSNKKTGRKNAFTKVIEGLGKVCDYTSGLLDKMRKRIDAEKASKIENDASYKTADRAQQELKLRLDRIEVAEPGMGDDILSEYRLQWRRQMALAKSKGWPLDYSIIDFRVAVHLLKAEFDSKDIVNAIIQSSPQLPDRHYDPRDYAQRTVSKATERLDKDAKPQNNRPDDASLEDDDDGFSL